MKHVRCLTSFVTEKGPTKGTEWHVLGEKSLLVVERTSNGKVIFRTDHRPMSLTKFLKMVEEGTLILHGITGTFSHSA